ncbi:TetR/AcrR family transcriptional regulator [Paenibacillus larvae]|nr:TetR/AcrR family transcriptional regulator [Paenibacillus larvae]MDT2241973.1 TetR/AcrR family transcriptional regulator [Paenibacillus larvae]
MSAPSKRQHILDAACRIVKELGAVHLTLDAVAKEARVSKGGLLYHFPSKEALIQEMITHMDEKYLKNVEALSRQDKESRGIGPGHMPLKPSIKWRGTKIFSPLCWRVLPLLLIRSNL